MCKDSKSLRATMGDMLEVADKWIHIALLLGGMAVEHGADPARVDYLLGRASKKEVDRLLHEHIGKKGK